MVENHGKRLASERTIRKGEYVSFIISHRQRKVQVTCMVTVKVHI